MVRTRRMHRKLARTSPCINGSITDNRTDTLLYCKSLVSPDVNRNKLAFGIMQVQVRRTW